MAVFALHLGISPAQLTRRNNPVSKAEETEFRVQRQLALERDNYVCQGCGIAIEPKSESGTQAAEQNTGASAGGLEVHHINYNPHDNSLGNLCTLCPFCHATQHIGFFARRFQEAIQLIYCPEISQADLNLLSWTQAIVLLRIQDLVSSQAAVYRGKIMQLRDKLCARSDVLEPLFVPARAGEGQQSFPKQKSQDVQMFATLLGHLQQNNQNIYDKRHIWLRNVRLYFDPCYHTSFTDHQNGNIVLRLSATTAWQPQETWLELWASIAKSMEAYWQRQ